jgi:hypothetical protein
MPVSCGILVVSSQEVGPVKRKKYCSDVDWLPCTGKLTR